MALTRIITWIYTEILSTFFSHRLPICDHLVGIRRIFLVEGEVLWYRHWCCGLVSWIHAQIHTHKNKLIQPLGATYSSQLMLRKFVNILFWLSTKDLQLLIFQNMQLKTSSRQFMFLSFLPWVAIEHAVFTDKVSPSDTGLALVDTIASLAKIEWGGKGLYFEEAKSEAKVSK